MWSCVLEQMRKDLLRQLLQADVEVVSVERLRDDGCGGMRKLKVFGPFEQKSAVLSEETHWC